MTQPPGRHGQPCLICGTTPTRFYISGARCRKHTPSAERGRPEPPPGRCAPARCYCGRPECHAYETFVEVRRGPQEQAREGEA